MPSLDKCPDRSIIIFPGTEASCILEMDVALRLWFDLFV